MFRGETLIYGPIGFGQVDLQDFALRSQNVEDILKYLQVELSMEVLKAMPFVTKDLIHFEKRPSGAVLIKPNEKLEPCP